MQRKEVNILDGDAPPVMTVKLSPSGGPADMDPVRGFVASAGESLPLHKGFQQDRLIPIQLRPVTVNLPGGQSQDVRSQVGYMNPGQYIRLHSFQIIDTFLGSQPTGNGCVWFRQAGKGNTHSGGP